MGDNSLVGAIRGNHELFDGLRSAHHHPLHEIIGHVTMEQLSWSETLILGVSNIVWSSLNHSMNFSIDLLYDVGCVRFT